MCVCVCVEGGGGGGGIVEKTDIILLFEFHTFTFMLTQGNECICTLVMEMYFHK